ncbi:PREDICTED: C-type mannose receptor 2-like [Cyprinodon variegatus]|uniref:C-type mannose receptor 2-like n=1 Tax=Cyprinodon variegatus TaxID=28743 RepID=UPI0007427D23|nr:PREDICTED: C-type mannose receptor 2-like [Cyprinodon variegatus]
MIRQMFDNSNELWNTNQPNDYEGVENCGVLTGSLTLENVSCNTHNHFLCYDSNSFQKFHLIQQNKTWLEAQRYCRENHTDLVSGLPQLQEDELKGYSSLIEKHFLISIGLFRDTWRWSDGSSFSFRHWNDQFNNDQYNTGQCAMTVFDDEGRWKTDSCTVRKPFICYDDKVILMKEKMNWEDALYYCRDHYHDLVTITSLDEQRWIQEKAKNASTDYVWMGLRYNCLKNMWFWVCKEIRFNHKSQVSEEQMRNCDMSGAIETRGKHRWIQGNDTEELNFICSKV